MNAHPRQELCASCLEVGAERHLFMQEGEETSTEMSSFLLCGDRQLHDLHSKLLLEHPRGTANQLHK